ncbi:hypothetical protein AVEN_146284-1, partial [Araneus ventricosus]
IHHLINSQSIPACLASDLVADIGGVETRKHGRFAGYADIVQAKFFDGQTFLERGLQSQASSSSSGPS